MEAQYVTKMKFQHFLEDHIRRKLHAVDPEIARILDDGGGGAGGGGKATDGTAAEATAVESKRATPSIKEKGDEDEEGDGTLDLLYSGVGGQDDEVLDLLYSGVNEDDPDNNMLGLLYGGAAGQDEEDEEDDEDEDDEDKEEAKYITSLEKLVEENLERWNTDVEFNENSGALTASEYKNFLNNQMLTDLNEWRANRRQGERDGGVGLLNLSVGDKLIKRGERRSKLNEDKAKAKKEKAKAKKQKEKAKAKKQKEKEKQDDFAALPLADVQDALKDALSVDALKNLAGNLPLGQVGYRAKSKYLANAKKVFREAIHAARNQQEWDDIVIYLNADPEVRKKIDSDDIAESLRKAKLFVDGNREITDAADDLQTMRNNNQKITRDLLAINTEIASAHSSPDSSASSRGSRSFVSSESDSDSDSSDNPGSSGSDRSLSSPGSGNSRSSGFDNSGSDRLLSSPGSSSIGSPGSPNMSPIAISPRKQTPSPIQDLINQLASSKRDLELAKQNKHEDSVAGFKTRIELLVQQLGEAEAAEELKNTLGKSAAHALEISSSSSNSDRDSASGGSPIALSLPDLQTDESILYVNLHPGTGTSSDESKSDDDDEFENFRPNELENYVYNDGTTCEKGDIVKITSGDYEFEYADVIKWLPLVKRETEQRLSVKVRGTGSTGNLRQYISKLEYVRRRGVVMGVSTADKLAHNIAEMRRDITKFNELNKNSGIKSVTLQKEIDDIIDDIKNLKVGKNPSDEVSVNLGDSEYEDPSEEDSSEEDPSDKVPVNLGGKVYSPGFEKKFVPDYLAPSFARPARPARPALAPVRPDPVHKVSKLRL